MNIHYFFGTHRTSAQAREIGLPIHSSKGTQKPRSRVGLKVDAKKHAKNVYPGGKSLRRARQALAIRTAQFDAERNTQGLTRPGSMSA